MLPTVKATRCRAKVRSSCRFHTAEDRVLAAVKASDITAYFDAASELDALRASNWEEGGWGFIRPQDRQLESLADVDALLASKSVLADSYHATFEYGFAMRPALVRRSAKRSGISYTEAKSGGGVKFEFEARSKRDLRFLKHLLEHNARMLADDDDQFAAVNRT